MEDYVAMITQQFELRFKNVKFSPYLKSTLKFTERKNRGQLTHLALIFPPRVTRGGRRPHQVVRNCVRQLSRSSGQAAGSFGQCWPPSGSCRQREPPSSEDPTPSSPSSSSCTS